MKKIERFIKVELFFFLMAINFKRFRTDSGVTKNYVSAGRVLGAALSMRGYGEAVGIQKRIRQLVGWEREYASRGFRTISTVDFTQAGGWNKDIGNLVGVKREEGEEPIFHAQKFQQNYRTSRALGMEGMMAAIETGESQYRKINPNS